MSVCILITGGKAAVVGKAVDGGRREPCTDTVP